MDRRRLFWTCSLLAVAVPLLPACWHAGLDPHRPRPAPAPGKLMTGANLKLLATYPLAVKEPSGMSVSRDGKSLWIVSDQSELVHQVTLEGRPIRQFHGLPDMEGVAVIDDVTVAVIGEGTRQVAQFDLKGKLLRQETLDLPGNDNSGPEGLAFDREGKRFFVVKEKAPGMLLVLDETMKETRREELGFALDYSDVAWEPVRKHLWILSHESKTAFVFDEDLRLLARFYTGVPQQEGLYVDYPHKRLYVVCDRTETLYVFEFADY